MDIPLYWLETFFESWIQENEEIKKRQEREMEKIRNASPDGRRRTSMAEPPSFSNFTE